MSPRLLDSTKLIWCFIVLNSGPAWIPVNSVTVRTPSNIPSTVEAQAKFFQDFFSIQLSPYKIEFGHVCEDPNIWEQRYEKKDFKNHRDMGKVRWGDKKGGYGEHYWDLNHAGHTGDHGNDGYDDDSDDGSYHEDPHDYNDSNKRSQNYETDEYNPDDTSHYEESGRSKRANLKIKSQPQKGDNLSTNEQYRQPMEKPHSEYEEDYKVINGNVNEEEITSKMLKIKHKKNIHEQNAEETPQNKEKNHIVLIVNQNKKDDDDDERSHLYPKYIDLPPYKEPKRYVRYEGGAGVRQHVQPEISASAQIPRLFLEPSTGHVVDRTTGQAYVLQPIHYTVHHN